VARVTDQVHDEALLGDEHPEQVAQELVELAEVLREVLTSAVLARPRAGELLGAIEQARSLARTLAEVSSVDDLGEGAVHRPYDPNRFNPVSGGSNAVAPPLRMWQVSEGPDGPQGRRTQGTVRFGPAFQGPPGHVHGAMVAAMYDDLLGRSQLVAGFTGAITVRYRRPTPLDRELEVRAWVDRVDGRKRWVHGTCHLDGELLTEAEGLFIAPKGGATLAGIVGALDAAAPG
jgi:hypothetical protein